MEDVDSLLLISLSSVPICTGLRNLSDLLDSAIFMQVSLDCLSVILHNDALPKIVPTLLSAKVQLCTDLGQKLKTLGFRGDIGFNTFLYPDLKHVRTLMSFIAEKLPREEEKQVVEERRERPLQRKIKAKLREWVKEDWSPPFGLRPCRPLKTYPILPLPDESSVPRELLSLFQNYRKYRESSYLTLIRTVPEAFASSIAEETTLKRVQESDRVDFAVKTEAFSVPPLHQQVEMPVTSDILGQPLTEEKAGEVEDTGGFFSHVVEFAQEQEIESQPQIPTATSSTPAKTVDLQSQWSEETASLEQELETLVQEEATAQAQVTALEMQIEALKQKQENTKERNVEMTKELEKQHRTAVLITSAATDVVSLKKEVQESQQKLEEMKREWEAYKSPLVDEVRTKRERIEQLKENYTDKIEEIKQMKEDLQDMANEAQMKDEMIDLLIEEEAKSSTNLNRNAFIQRITEVIDKLKRQKHEIGKILKDVQDMQSSITFNRDTLKRVDSATEDLVFQEAKKDASSKVMYKMLTDLRVVYEELIRAVEEQNAVKSSIRDVEIRMDSVKARNVNHDIARLREDLSKIREESKRR